MNEPQFGTQQASDAGFPQGMPVQADALFGGAPVQDSVGAHAAPQPVGDPVFAFDPFAAPQPEPAFAPAPATAPQPEPAFAPAPEPSTASAYQPGADLALGISAKPQPEPAPALDFAPTSQPEAAPAPAPVVESPAAAQTVPASSAPAAPAHADEGSWQSFFAGAHVADGAMLEGDDDEVEGDISDTSSRAFMQNRELSWLTFDERVLDQGADESVPLLERLNFISIFWSNLQEFFMVRVGSLTDLTFIDPPVRDSKTGMTPGEQIKAIHERCRELYPIQESYYEHVRGSLAKEGVRHLRPDDLSDEQRNYLSGFVTFNVEPFLSPQIINPRHPFPHLENGKLYILVRLDDEADAVERKKDKKDKKGKKKKKEKGGAEGVLLGLIPLPHQCDRLIKLPGRGYQFILLEHAIEMFASEIFSMYKIKHTNVICVTRNADIDANQTGDEQDEDYREHMKRLLKKRARLAPVRLECERPLSPVMEKLMLKKLGLKRSQVYDTIVPLDLSFTWGLGARLSESKRKRLSNPPFTPAWPAVFDRKKRIMDQVTDREVLLSYPYESMDPFVQLLKEAAFDPGVISIKITLYRLASQSQLAEALITAAENGKSVTALFELRARFDESNNIEWSQRFEQAGCNVIYGFRDYKVHSKICCITRQLPDGSIQHITQLGTGNYNEKTAKLYTDLSFITTDEAFGRDAMEFFRNMQLENVSDNYQMLRVAPLQIKPMILENLDRQIALARAGKPCGAFMKANSITDKEVIEKIAEASQAGVGITLFIRGICCIVPDLKGLTENVRVVSIVGRLLEHSRIYCFGTPGDCVMYLSSADLMTRNLNKRVEIAWPILNADIQARILEYVDICLHDTAKLRELRPNATYTPLGAFCDLDEEGNAQPLFDAQAALIERAAEKARKAEEETAARHDSIAKLPQTLDALQGAYDIAPAHVPAVVPAVEVAEPASVAAEQPVSAAAPANEIETPSLPVEMPAAVTEPEPAPAMEPAQVFPEPAAPFEQAPAPEVAFAFEPQPSPEPEIAPAPEETTPEPMPAFVPEPAMVLEPAPAFVPEPAAIPEPQPPAAPEPAPAFVSAPVVEPVFGAAPEPANIFEQASAPALDGVSAPEQQSSDLAPVPASGSVFEAAPASMQAAEPASDLAPEFGQAPAPTPAPEPEPVREPEVALKLDDILKADLVPAQSQIDPAFAAVRPVQNVLSAETALHEQPTAAESPAVEMISGEAPLPETEQPGAAGFGIALEREPEPEPQTEPEGDAEQAAVVQSEPPLTEMNVQDILSSGSEAVEVDDPDAASAADPAPGQPYLITEGFRFVSDAPNAVDENLVSDFGPAELPVSTGFDAQPAAHDALQLDSAGVSPQFGQTMAHPQGMAGNQVQPGGFPQPAGSFQAQSAQPGAYQPPADSAQQPGAFQAPVDPALQAGAYQVQPGAPTQASQNDFFDDSARELQMPPQKKKGFFSRRRKG